MPGGEINLGIPAQEFLVAKEKKGKKGGEKQKSSPPPPPPPRPPNFWLFLVTNKDSTDFFYLVNSLFRYF